MNADALAPYIAGTSASIVLTMRDKPAFVLEERQHLENIHCEKLFLAYISTS